MPTDTINTRHETIIGTVIERTERNDRIRAHCQAAGYSVDEIERGLLYAYNTRFSSDDEALSLVISRMLYGDDQLADGARFTVEPGSW